MAEILTPKDFFTQVEPDFAPEPPVAGGIVDTGAVEAGSTAWHFGYQFLAGEAIEATKLRLFADHAVAETVSPWDVATNALLASVEIVGGGALDWYEAAITPVTLEAGKSYIVSAWAGGASRSVQDGVENGFVGVTFHPGITWQALKANTSSGAYPGSTLVGPTILAADFGIEAVSSGPTEREFNTLVPTDMFSE